MNFVTTSLGIESFIDVNVKPTSMNIDNDKALHLTNKIRQIRDCTTDSFIGTFFKHNITPSTPDDEINNINNELARHLFLLYVYDVFKLNIQALFNEYLMLNGSNILNIRDEYTDFIFKGGNIMFIYVLEMLNNNPGLMAQVRSNPNIQRFINESFAVSDFDFTIYIKCQDHKKFIEVKKHLTSFVIKHLERINNFFNLHLIDVITKNPTLFNHDITDNNIKAHIIPQPSLSSSNVEPHIVSNIGSILSNDPNTQQKEAIDLLNTVSSLVADLYNNVIFDKLLSQVVKWEVNDLFINNTMLDIFSSITNNFIDKYHVNLTRYPSSKNIVLIENIIYTIITINQILTSLEARGINIRQCKLLYCSLINAVKIMDYINSKYSFTIFNIGPRLRQHYTDSINELNTYIRSLEEVIREINFYEPYKIHKFITDLSNRLYDKSRPLISPGTPNIARKSAQVFIKEPDTDSKVLFMDNSDYQDPSNFVQVKISNDTATSIPVNKLIIVGQNNMVVKDDIIRVPAVVNIEKRNNVHYLSYNSSINTSKNNYHSIVNFDLIRTKFSMRLLDALVQDIGETTFNRKSIHIPGEFIDISISSMEDTFACHYVSDALHNKKSYRLTIQGTPFSVESYTPSYMVYDLQGVLYSQNSYIPWSDGKYKKRIQRMLFIYGISSRVNYEFLRIVNQLIIHMTDFISENERSVPGGIPNHQLNNIHINFIIPHLFSATLNIRQHFIETLDKMVESHSSVLDFSYGNHLYYHKGIDYLVNSIFYLFLIYITFNHNIASNDPVNKKLLDINNYTRKDFNLIPYATVQELNDLYVKKIKEYLFSIKDVLETLINFIGIIF